MAFDPQEIYYGIDGQRHGPVDSETIRELLENGTLSPHDYIWMADSDEWLAISEIPHFASSMRVPLSDPPSPHGGWGPELPYAGFWIRLVAHVIDGFVLLLPMLIWFTIAMELSGFDATLLEQRDPMDLMFDPSILEDPVLRAEILRLEIFAWGGFWVLELLYRAAFESSRWQATIGKRLLGLSVVTEEGYRMNFGRAALRHVLKLISVIPFNLGYLIIAFHDRKQGFHDLLAKTFVLKN
jgi:uncharacterized RDD family membrane protein YckC